MFPELNLSTNELIERKFVYLAKFRKNKLY